MFTYLLFLDFRRCADDGKFVLQLDSNLRLFFRLSWSLLDLFAGFLASSSSLSLRRRHRFHFHSRFA